MTNNKISNVYLICEPINQNIMHICIATSDEQAIEFAYSEHGYDINNEWSLPENFTKNFIAENYSDTLPNENDYDFNGCYDDVIDKIIALQK